MKQARWETVAELFRAARERTAYERQDFLDEVCRGDEELRREVESLLEQPVSESGILEDFAREIQQGQQIATLDQSVSASGPNPANLPLTVGRYRVLGLIGEGGMGTVYKAEQDHPRRVVALKIVKAGFADSERARRFQRESEALGRLQHPGIAQIYEAGAAETTYGTQPCFAMEYIRGLALAQHVATQRLRPRQRIELMIKVCEAVEHAHQRGIIHRDLKPGNILVDETGQPKILDFGIARITDNENQLTQQTDAGHLIGTLAYMSPEQVLVVEDGEPPSVGARSDVYALGIILYELLAGRPPYRISREASEAVRAIREQEPSRLSAAAREYRGDLETIVHKALEKDKSRRYDSAAALAADLRRYLADEPILAQPPTTIYRARKFVRRHRTLVSATSVVFLALLAGVALSTREAIRANRERDRAVAAERRATEERDRALRAERSATSERNRAQQERNRAISAEARALEERNRAVAEKERADLESATSEAINNFLRNDLLAQASANGQSRPGARPDPDLKVRTALDRAAAGIAGKFESRPLVEASIRLTIGKTYQELGLFGDAEQQIEKAVALQTHALGEQHRDTLAGLTELASLYYSEEKFSQAERLDLKLIELQRRTLGAEHPDTLRTIHDLAEVYRKQGKYAEAEPLFLKVADSQVRILGPEDPMTLINLNTLAALYTEEGKFSQAEPLYERVVEARRGVLGPEHPSTLLSLYAQGTVFFLEGKYAQAEARFAEVLEVRRRVLGEEHPDTVVNMSSLGTALLSEGKYTEAERLLSRALEIQRRAPGEERPATLLTMSNLASVYLNQGKFKPAEELVAKTLEIQRRVLGEQHPNTLATQQDLADIYQEEGRYAEAEPLLKRAVDDFGRKLGEDHRRTLNARFYLGILYGNEGKYGEAEPLLTQVLEKQRRLFGDEHRDTLATMMALAETYRKQGRFEEAGAIFSKVLEVSRRAPGDRQAATAGAERGVGWLRLQQQRFTEAELLLRSALSSQENKDPENWQRFNTESLLGASLAGQLRYSEAEPLLLSGYEGMRQREEFIPFSNRYAVKEAGDRIVELYQSWGKQGKAAEWQSKLSR